MGREAHYDRLGRSGRKGIRYIETATAVALGSGGAAAMALRAVCSGIEIQDHTHLLSIVSRPSINGSWERMREWRLSRNDCDRLDLGAEVQSKTG